MPKSPIRVVTVIMAFKHKNEEEIRLRLNWLQTDSGNDFPENGGVWLLLQIRSKLKSISSWPNLRAKTTEMIFHFYFHFKLLLALENRRERERGRKKESIATSSASAVAPIAIDASIFARCVNLHAIAIDSLRERVDHDHDRTKRRPLRLWSRRSRSGIRLFEFDDFFLGFVCVLRNKWYYIFVW